MKRLLLIMGLITINSSLRAQQLFSTTNFQAAIKKETRAMTGKPGKNYWQNRADYNIRVNFDPATNLLNGEETVTYYNNSPDTLQRLIIRLYPDYYKKGVSRISPVKDKDLNEGVTIDQLKIGTEIITEFSDPQKAVHDNTNLIITPAEAIFPNRISTLIVKWHYRVNTGSQMRTGMIDSASYFIAYFFPRIAVYDDMDGWDDWSYNGIQEFYNDFGNYNVEISVPKNYVVWATGERQNTADNLSSVIFQKLEKATVSDTVIHVIDSTDYFNHTVFRNDATGIWKFKAENVTDFAFALSDHYLWDASGIITDSVKVTRTLASAAYNKIHLDYADVARQAQQSVRYLSHHYPKVPFPFPCITVFDGTDQMEYPMMINDNPASTHKDAVQLTTHEVGHSYFPFYIGINETQYAWMDEGWATIVESIISPLMGEPEDEGIFSKGRYERISGTDKDLPLISNTKLYQNAAYLANSYGKGAQVYWVLQDMLGDELYFKALRQFINDWHGKHPVPYDFFYSFNTATGKNLNWFWQKWFFDWVYPDLGINKVEQGNGVTKIVIVNKGGLPVPVHLSIVFGNGETKKFHYGADAWRSGNKDLTITITQSFPGGIRSLKLGNDFTPDKFREDNEWKK